VAAMIYVTTYVHKEHTAGQDQGSPGWRIQSCTIEFGPEREPMTLTSDSVYASPDAAHAAMRRLAYEQIRLCGYAVPEESVVWRLHLIG
jgi:hypothetical protein